MGLPHPVWMAVLDGDYSKLTAHQINDNNEGSCGQRLHITSVSPGTGQCVRVSVCVCLCVYGRNAQWIPSSISYLDPARPSRSHTVYCFTPHPIILILWLLRECPARESSETDTAGEMSVSGNVDTSAATGASSLGPLPPGLCSSGLLWAPLGILRLK